MRTCTLRERRAALIDNGVLKSYIFLYESGNIPGSPRVTPRSLINNTEGKAMTEKEMFLNAWQREFGTTLKILKQLPADKAGFKPAAEKTKSAQDLATIFMVRRFGQGRPCRWAVTTKPVSTLAARSRDPVMLHRLE